jgi:hypothetical protein
MKEDKIWQLFLESLWMYQYTKKPCPLTPELSHALYDVSQGITDLAVKVYMLAQVRAITRGEDEDEGITEALVRSVAYDSLRLANPILEALRSGNLLELHKVDDVLPIDIEPFIQEALRNYSAGPDPDGKTENTNGEEAKATKRRTTTSSKNSAGQKQGSDSPSTAKGTPKTKQAPPAKAQGELLEAVSQEIMKNGAAYEALLKAGYLKPRHEETTKEGDQ